MKGPNLGKLIVDHELRDAIHIAVAPVRAMENLKPGTWLTWHVQGNTEQVVACNPTRAIGIVDPFLTQSIKEGQYFWMLVKPNTITSLRHEWEHPAFDDARGLAEFWIREFADRCGMDHDELMAQAREGVSEFRFGNDFGDYPTDEEAEQFRKYVTMLTGREMPARPSFSCAC